MTSVRTMKKHLFAFAALTASIASAQTGAPEWTLRAVGGADIKAYATQAGCVAAAKALNKTQIYECPRLYRVTAAPPPPPPPPPPPVVVLPAPPAGATATMAFGATSADVPNPERGFYGWSGSDIVGDYCQGCVDGAYGQGLRLMLTRADLAAFRGGDISASWLNTLGNRLGAVRASGMKVVLWFAYDSWGGGSDTSAAQIKRHLGQLKPVLEANADVIPYMRAGFIGAWSEWHSSTSGNSCGYNSGSTTCSTADAKKAIVRDALLANVPASVQIAMRYPVDTMKWYPSAAQQNRIGAHNDCFMAGPSDSGTYSSQSQRDYVAAQTENTAFGAETCQGGETPLRNQCADILREGAQFHVAWLSSTYAAAFLDQWKAQGCYAQVSSLLGYRLQIDQLRAPVTATRGTAITVDVDLRNTGWARMFGQARPLVVLLRHKASGALLSAASGQSLRSLAPQATRSTRMSVNVNIPAGAASGDYAVLIGAPDPSASLAGDARFAVRFANADNAGSNQAWEASTGALRSGSVVSVQ